MATETATVVATTPPETYPGRIAFVTSGGQVGSVAADGEMLRLLTGEERFYLFPAWSPDGKTLAAIGSDREGAGVFLLPDEEEVAVTTLFESEQNAPIYLYWAPDGKQVSFIAQRGDSLGLYLVPADSGEASRLLTTGQPFYWDWSAESEKLLIHTGGDSEDARLAFVEIAERQSGENLAAPGFFQAPGISRDGAYVAFASVDEAESRWLVVEAQAGETIHRVPHRGAVALSWNPTRDELAFISPEFAERRPLLDYYGPLRLLDASSGEARLLVEESVLAFFWAPDGDKLAYFTIAGIDDERFEAARLDRFGRRSKTAQVQQDELQLQLWVMDVMSGERRRLLTFRPTNLFLRQFLPYFDQYALSHSLWSPDSRALVLPVQEGRDETIYVVPVNGQSMQMVGEGEVAFWSQ
jgi:TolB protein